MKRTIISLFALVFLSLFSLISCENDTKNNIKNSHFPEENTAYLVEFELEEWNGKAKLFLKEDTLHLIHSDEASPLYQMEEIYTEEKFFVKYQGISYETEPYKSGCGMIFHLISAICENEPNNKQKEKEVTHFTYKTEDFNFILTKNNKEPYPLIITGIDNPTYFKIKIEKLT